MGTLGNQDRDDKQLSPWANRIILSLFVLVIGGGIVWIVGGAWWHEYRKLTILHNRGQRVEAQVQDIYQQKRYNRQTTDCEEVADYEFTTGNGKVVAKNAINLGSCDAPNSALDYVTTHHSVPLAYDPSDLSLVELNFADSIFVQNPKDTMSNRLHFSGNILFEIGIIFSLVLALLWNIRRKYLK